MGHGSSKTFVVGVAALYFGLGAFAAPWIKDVVENEKQEEIETLVIYQDVFIDRPAPRPEVVYLNTEVSHDEDLYCLAHNIYHEARGETVEGQIAVGYVTMNRVKTSSHNWPDTVCGNVFQRKQFSWTLDRPYINLSRESERRAYVRAVRIASGVLEGKWEDKTEGATHYYAIKGMKDQKEPWWAGDYKVVSVVGNHTFLK